MLETLLYGLSKKVYLPKVDAPDELDWKALDILLSCEEVPSKVLFSPRVPSIMLTLEQLALIPIYKEKWKKILISSDIIDRSKAKANTILLYRSIGLSKPQIIFVYTPI